ncbi:MAG: SH3 domain-containing protein [Flavobacteriaceae bacterium]
MGIQLKAQHKHQASYNVSKGTFPTFGIRNVLKHGFVARKIALILFLSVPFWAMAQNNTLFNGATDAYNNGDYTRAIENYLQILENGQHSASLYYNLGNSYYKLNQIAPSIYYYEKALLVSPDDTEIKNNLGYAQNMTVDDIEVLPETGLSKLYDNIIGPLSFEQWAYLAVGSMLLFVCLYLMFYFMAVARAKRISFILALLFLLVSLGSVLFAYLQYQEFQADNPAIVFPEQLQVRSEPNNRSEVVFTLHEGTKVNVLEALNEYHRIQLTDGKTGWVPSEAIKIIRDF